MNTLKLVLQNEIVIPKLPQELISQVKSRLTIDNPEFASAIKFNRTTRGLSKFLRFYRDVGETFFLPRGFLNELLELLAINGYQADVTDETVSFNVKEIKPLPLWEYQKPWVGEMLSDPMGVGIAPPGGGKTIMGLELYAALGQPCIWLTHTRGLARQTADRLKFFTGEEAGLIGSGKDEVKHFTVGLIPTLIKRDLTKYVKEFGLVIVDECHHTPAESFFAVTNQFHARYRYGLTATPYRDDGLQAMMFHALGPASATLDRQTLRDMGKLMTPTVYRRRTKFTYPYNPASKKFGYKPMEKALGFDLDRNSKIIGDVLLEAFTATNTCIILVGRVEHGELLYQAISNIYPSVGIVHSKMTPKKADQAMSDFSSGKFRILIATYRMLAEGFDYQPSNRLFLTAPFKGRSLIEQACGRIERVFEGKVDAIVYDYVDYNLGVLRNQSEMRLDVYEANNNPVVNLEDMAAAA